MSSPDEPVVKIRPLGKPGDLGWVVMAHGEQYAAEFGWDASFEALVAGIVGDFARTLGTGPQRGWIAELGAKTVGVCAVHRGEPDRRATAASSR